MKFKYKLILSLSLALVILVANVGIVQAKVSEAQCNAEWVLTCDIIPKECTDNDMKTECGFQDMATTMVHIAQWILAVVGAVSFGYFVYGGFTLMTAAGNTARVDQGRRILIGTVIGIFIVLGAFQLVRYVGILFGGGTSPDGYNLFLDVSENQCTEAGDPCVFPGETQRVYACAAGNLSCSSESLCDYWSDPSRVGTNHNLTTDHDCRNNSLGECDTDTIVPNLCPGDAGVIVCCEPN